MTYKTCVYLVCSILVFGVAPMGQLASQNPGGPAKKKEEKNSMIEWGPELNGVRCAVALPIKQEKIFAGESVHVLFLTKNFGGKPVSVITERHPLYIFTVSVVGPDEKPAPLTSYGRQQMDGAGRGSRGKGKVAAGEEDKSGLFLSRIFDMTRQGEYKVSFSRSIWTADDTRVLVTSNVLTVTVAGEKAEYEPN